MRNFYLAVAVQQNKNESIFEPDKEIVSELGSYAYVVPISESDNIKSRLNSIGGLVYANICTSKKAAAQIVEAWNEGYKAEGTYLFDAPLF